ncbi:MAG: DUF4831 family protein [Bacteroides sp.]|nr:DUF4831 family protein [Bacteroides sp.]MCM1379618.1 DUF4831 family protein [Bacteroides sp.]MCM1446000.1 DUF4831 family protein [Prevotella sp.]
MKKLIILSIAIATTLGAAAQSVSKLSATKANDYGVAYSLPQTSVDITLEAEQTVAIPGEFYNYAERYLGADAARKAVKSASTTWKLLSAVIVPTGEIPSGAETYLMQFKGGSPVFAMLSAEGMPLTINSEDLPAAAEKVALPETKALTKSPLDGNSARYAVTEEMLQSSSLAKRAQLAADQIMQLRQSRQDYLTGQADNMPDGKALELILKNINAQEEALTAMFLGTVQTSTAVTTVSYTPGNDSAENVVIARLNALSGFVGANDLSGAPIYLDYTVKSRGELPLDEKGKQKVFPKGGVPYCIPGSALFTVTFDGHILAKSICDVSQLGIVFGIDPTFFSNKKTPGYAIFDPLTGALKELGN